VDADVTGLYPSIAIQNRMYPEHLGERFVEVYKTIPAERAKYPKGTPRNRGLKLAANGAYGNSNNEWSPLCDPQYTMQTTINGQLMLLMLAERLLRLGVEIIQVNTDGITYAAPPHIVPFAAREEKIWQQETRLELEYANYRSFYCRDVNNYLAVKTDGEIKAKGAYYYPRTQEEYNGWWHKDWSALCVQKAVEEQLVRGVPVEIGIRDNRDPFDFMLRYKTPRGS